MKSISLRTRMLTGLAFIMIVLTVISWFILTSSRSHLTDQVDQRLVAASGPIRNARVTEFPDRPARPELSPQAEALLDRRERIGTMYELIIDREGGTTELFAPNLPGLETSPPAVAWVDVAGRDTAPFTVKSMDSATDYRVVATPLDSDRFAARAISLQEVNATIRQLVWALLLSLGTIALACCAVAWWVIRLGIRPIEAMTDTAIEVADGDLSQRVTEQANDTETGRLARALNTMLGRIEQAADAQTQSEDRLRQFVSDASHELRTPVTTVRGYAELYRHGGLEDRAALDDAMRRTEQESQRMGRLVDDLLNLAKLDEVPALNLSAVDLAALVTDTVADSRITATTHHIETTTEGDTTLTGDADRLRQLLANVVGNATVHTPAGTTVTIAVRCSANEHDAVVLEVRDTGPGMSAAQVERATERFYRADPSRSRDRGGSGLGLSVAAAIVKAHHGTMHLSSEPNVGTTVTIRLPRTDRSAGSTTDC